jgi:predicted GNAT family N-acyltransferase
MNTLVKEVSWSEYQAELMSVRTAVFVVEQEVPEELERDEWDAKSQHVLLFCDDQSIGTGRLLPDGHIGRVAVLKSYRGHSFGNLLMKKLLSMARASGFKEVELSAQVRVQGFYEKLGFSAKGEIYQEAGISHINMEKQLKD